MRNYEILGIIKPFSSIAPLKKKTERKLVLKKQTFKSPPTGYGLESERRQTWGNNICYRLPSQKEGLGKAFFKQQKFPHHRPWILSQRTAVTPTPTGRATQAFQETSKVNQKQFFDACSG